MKWFCTGCGHHHGTNQCQAITETENGGAAKCGCRNHQEQDQAA